MASYGGYSMTTYGAGGDADGGGFMSGSQQGSQGAGGKSYSDESVRPCTVKQLFDCHEAFPNAELSVDGHAITTVTVVGQIRAIKPQATNVTYTLDDGTATMDVKKWIDADADPMTMDKPETNFPVGGYVRVYGRLKTFNNKKHLAAHVIRPVDDFNEVSYHLLEAIYVHLFHTKGLPTGGPGVKSEFGDGGAKTGGAGGDSMFVDASNPQDKFRSLSVNARTIYMALKHANVTEGMHLNLMAKQTGLTYRDCKAAIDEMYEQGMAYETMDSESFALMNF